MTVLELMRKLLDCPLDAIACADDNEAGTFEIDHIRTEPMLGNNPYIDHGTGAKTIVVLS